MHRALLAAMAYVAVALGAAAFAFLIVMGAGATIIALTGGN